MAIKLTICAPLFYKKAELSPFARDFRNEERLFCFEIAKEKASAFEPAESDYLGNLIVSGECLAGNTDCKPNGSLLELPEGVYLFAQEREYLCEEDCVRLAIEVQKDGLWERLALDRFLFLRRLFEDGKTVTQILRPLQKTNNHYNESRGVLF
jgi:hypothetical protein